MWYSNLIQQQEKILEREYIMEPASPEQYALASQFIGLSEEDANKLAEKHGHEYRVMFRDGELYAGTADYQPARLNFAIVDGIVVGVNFG